MTKFRTRELGCGGATHDFNCNICFARKNDVEETAPFRTVKIIENLSTRAMWNPKMRTTNSLYNESKGCERPGIAPQDPHLFCTDELHVLLNIQVGVHIGH